MFMCVILFWQTYYQTETGTTYAILVSQNLTEDFLTEIDKNKEIWSTLMYAIVYN